MLKSANDKYVARDAVGTDKRGVCVGVWEKFKILQVI